MLLLWFGSIFVLLFLFFYWNDRRHPKESALGVDGEILYADQGRQSRAFVSKRYGIRAKPDFIIRLNDGRVALVEYKSRDNGRVYTSDIVQAKASVLAARTRYPVEVMFIKTGERLQQIPIPKDSDALYKEIARYVGLARKANSGEMILEYTKNESQCKTCSVKVSCKK